MIFWAWFRNFYYPACKALKIVSMCSFKIIFLLQTKEQHLQDLLEAKTLALNQADRMLNQHRARKGQDEAEVWSYK